MNREEAPLSVLKPSVFERNLGPPQRTQPEVVVKVWFLWYVFLVFKIFIFTTEVYLAAWELRREVLCLAFIPKINSEEIFITGLDRSQGRKEKPENCFRSVI